jgi:hypothetical protein
MELSPPLSNSPIKRNCGKLRTCVIFDTHEEPLTRGTRPDRRSAGRNRSEDEGLRSKLKEQVEEFCFTPPRADKSKRLEGTAYHFTVTRGLTTEIRDAAVERIRQVCPGDLFDRLFKGSNEVQAGCGSHAGSRRPTAAGHPTQPTSAF